MNELLSITSHELRTPLAVIQGNVQLAARQLQRLACQGETQPEFLPRQNALKYSSQDLPVEVLLGVEGDSARVSVRDEGEGLPQEVQERVWECFYRADKDHVQSGLGLGLHICKMIIQWHQGQVGVQSAPGEGATFWFTLPLAEQL
jgi:signal transduction histidine kinase